LKGNYLLLSRIFIIRNRFKVLALINKKHPPPTFLLLFGHRLSSIREEILVLSMRRYLRVSKWKVLSRAA
jgi:hypothetical protein